MVVFSILVTVLKSGLYKSKMSNWRGSKIGGITKRKLEGIKAMALYASWRELKEMKINDEKFCKGWKYKNSILI